MELSRFGLDVEPIKKQKWELDYIKIHIRRPQKRTTIDGIQSQSTEVTINYLLLRVDWMKL